MNLGLKDKVTVVTGASRGLGKAIAHGFAAEGAKLAICSRTEATIQGEARDLSTRYQTEVHWEACDLLNPGAADRFIERTIHRFGHVDVLVNNLGAGLSRPFDEVSEEDWQRVMDINLKAAIRCCKTILPTMKERGKGRIINIAALSGKVPRLGQIASNVAKAALINFTESLACEVAPYGIRVNAVCPAAVLTERWEERVNRAAKARGEDFTTAMRNMARKFIPVGRFGAPEEVASAVVFLASEKADFITGTCLMVDGGIGKAVSISLE
ncbi:MAG: glucose 1-dehydrogenase [Deltaproteobacteria bacterium]|nr:glucose 1-dehydrogenase [Deltaproteobacteria bacterium]